MCKAFSSLISFFLLFALQAQPRLKLTEERTSTGYAVFASNLEYCPVSVEILFELENLQSSIGTEKIVVTPPRTEKYKIADLIYESGKNRFGYRIRSSAAFGDVTLTEYDETYAYDLPYEKGAAHAIHQGYNGKLSHQNENALDFTMPEGTRILAARGGVVVKVVEHNTQNCLKPECKDYNNYILICHSDGTFAEYVHLLHQGARVKPGDAVRQGDLIALSGNTGWTTGPHLHFACFLPGKDDRRTIKTKFRVDDGSRAEFLEEKRAYLRGY